jgi:hypothetical protein
MSKFRVGHCPPGRFLKRNHFDFALINHWLPKIKLYAILIGVQYVHAVSITGHWLMDPRFASGLYCQGEYQIIQPCEWVLRPIVDDFRFRVLFRYPSLSVLLCLYLGNWLLRNNYAILRSGDFWLMRFKSNCRSPVVEGTSARLRAPSTTTYLPDSLPGMNPN